MITFSNIKRFFSSPVDSAPWTYLFYDANNTGCVSFSNPSGITNANEATTDISFSNSVCLDEAEIKLRVEGINGCVSVVDILLEDPCAEFSVPGIFRSNPFTFSVSPTGGTAPYLYEWTWDTAIFTSVSSDTNNPAVSFQVIPQIKTILGVTVELPLPDSTTVLCKITDANGCSETVITEHTICKPVAPDSVYSLYCNEELPWNPQVIIFGEACTGMPIKWQNLKLMSVPPALNVVHLYSAGLPISPYAPVNILDVKTASSSVLPGNYEIKYRLVDIYGVISKVGTITIVVPECPPAFSGLSILGQTVTVPQGTVVGDPITFDISNSVITSNPIDWNSFRLLKSGTAQAATALAEDNLYDDIITPNITYSARARSIYYEVPALGYTDSFDWSISTVDGECVSNAATYVVNLLASAAPTANANTACTVCGQPVTIAVLANDSANGRQLNPCTLTITSGPTSGVAVINAIGEVVYTPHEGFEGVDVFQYTISNNDVPALTSSAATVTITVLCSGEPTNINVCN